MAKSPKVPFNCLLPAGTVKAIRDQAEADKCSQADVVHRAIALLCFGEEIAGQAIAPRLAYSQELAAIKKQVTPRQENRVPPIGAVSRDEFKRSIRPKGDKTR